MRLCPVRWIDQVLGGQAAYCFKGVGVGGTASSVVHHCSFYDGAQWRELALETERSGRNVLWGAKLLAVPPTPLKQYCFKAIGLDINGAHRRRLAHRRNGLASSRPHSTRRAAPWISNMAAGINEHRTRHPLGGHRRLLFQTQSRASGGLRPPAIHKCRWFFFIAKTAHSLRWPSSAPTAIKPAIPESQLPVAATCLLL